MLTLGNKIIAGSFKTGASWEVGDVGISSFGIDEALNKRRYLNGQVISQAQFVEFTAMLKSRVSVYPNLATTEVNWQAEVTNSKLGQCGKFVIDDVAGTIRLPKVVNINGLQNLTGLGGIKAESLPNITGKVGQYDTSGNIQNTVSGAFYSEQDTGLSGGYQAWVTGTNNKEKFDASRSSSTYQDNAPVQQEAVQYPYFIQVATGVETSIDVSREIELNNPFTLFQYQWSSFILNNASWLRADTFSWQSGTVYVSAYEQLLTEYNAGTSETAEGITYRLTSTGKKIALADQEKAIASLYASTGSAWYYILDTENQRFKLPRELPFDGQAKGNGMTLGLTNGTDNFGMVVPAGSYQPLKGATGSYGANVGINQSVADNLREKSIVGITTDPTKSGIILNRDNTDSQKYLYFYVGETIQDANIIAASAALTTISNLTPCHVVIDTYVNGTSWYRIYDDGWCEQGDKIVGGNDGMSSVYFIKNYVSEPQIYPSRVWRPGGDAGGTGVDRRQVTISNPSTTGFSIWTNGWGSVDIYWEAKGYLAQGEY